MHSIPDATTFFFVLGATDMVVVVVTLLGGFLSALKSEDAAEQGLRAIGNLAESDDNCRRCMRG